MATKKYPDWYPESLQGLTYNTGASTDIVGTQVDTNHINPNTGVNFTPEEVTYYKAPVKYGDPFAEGYTGVPEATSSCYGATSPCSGGTSPSTATPTGSHVSNIYFEGNPLGPTPEGFSNMSQSEQEAYISENFGVDVSGQIWSFAPYMSPEQIAAAQASGHKPPTTGGGTATSTTSTTSTFGGGAAAGIPAPEVSPAPAYEISPEQQAFEDMYGGKLTDWVEAGGYGIPEETQNLMIQQQTDSLKAREQENIRVMRNNMERRGITNSGFTFANEQNIRSNTSVAIAGAIADVQIKSALMKMSSFEKAMGQAGQFLGYLSEQSQLQYQPEFATWQAEQMAKLQGWQAKMDVYKMELNQAYQTQNMKLEAQLQSQLNTQQHAWDIELAEMEIEANQQIAMSQGAGNLFGTILGFIFGK